MRLVFWVVALEVGQDVGHDVGGGVDLVLLITPVYHLSYLFINGNSITS